MMYLTIVLAILTSNVLIIGLTFAVMFSPKFMSWWIKKYYKLIMKMAEELEDLDL